MTKDLTIIITQDDPMLDRYRVGQNVAIAKMLEEVKRRPRTKSALDVMFDQDPEMLLSSQPTQA